MSFLNLFKGPEQPEQPVLTRIPNEKNDGRWAPEKVNPQYETDPEIIKKIRHQREIETKDYQKN